VRAERNPWNANTLEWTVDSPPRHPNFPVPPQVYRDAYEYSVPGALHDWIPQDAPPEEPDRLETGGRLNSVRQHESGAQD